MKNVKLKMSMFRPLKNENYNEIYQSEFSTYLYVVLRHLCKSDVTISTNPRMLFQTLSDKEPSKSDIKRIKEGLDILFDNEIISYSSKGNNYSITPLDLDIDKEDLYFHVPVEYIKMIIEKKNGIKLLRHYLLLCSTINVLEHTGMHDRKFFADCLNIDIKTVTKHHQSFVEMGLICFSEHRNGMDKEGNFINLPKLYTMPDHENILKEMQEKKLKYQIKEANKKINKAKRSFKEEQKKVKEVQIEDKEELMKNHWNNWTYISNSDEDDYEEEYCPF